MYIVERYSACSKEDRAAADPLGDGQEILRRRGQPPRRGRRLPEPLVPRAEEGGGRGLRGLHRGAAVAEAAARAPEARRELFRPQQNL